MYIKYMYIYIRAQNIAVIFLEIFPQNRYLVVNRLRSFIQCIPTYLGSLGNPKFCVMFGGLSEAKFHQQHTT